MTELLVLVLAIVVIIQGIFVVHLSRRLDEAARLLFLLDDALEFLEAWVGGFSAGGYSAAARQAGHALAARPRPRSDGKA